MIDASSNDNRADFQRHFNGCERRLQQFGRSVELLAKIKQKSLDLCHEQLTKISQEETDLASIIVALDRSPFVSSVEKRFDRLKKTFLTHRNTLETLRSKLNVQPMETVALVAEEPSKSIELQLLAETNGKIKRVEEDLQILHGTFYDLHRIVHEQGLTIENIEESISATDQMVEEGKEEIQQTIDVKKRTRKTRWVLLVLLSTVSLLLILILFLVYKFAFPFSRY